MKKQLWVIPYALCLMGCGKSEKEIIIPEENRQILQFSVNLKKEVSEFPTTRSMPEMDIPEPSIKNPSNESDSEPGNLFTRLEYLVYQSGDPTTPFKHKRFKMQDDDFGIVYDTLPPGGYQIHFLAHSSSDMQMTGQTAKFEKVSDTFHHLLSHTVTPGSELIDDIHLQRIISKIEFVATDAVSEKLKSLEMTVSGYQNQVNLDTKLGTSQNISYTETYDFLPSDIGKTGLTHSFYTFIPSGNETIENVNLTAYNIDSKISRERNVKDILPIKNRIIRYSGNLYTPSESDDTFTIYISDDGIWGGADENDLPK